MLEEAHTLPDDVTALKAMVLAVDRRADSTPIGALTR